MNNALQIGKKALTWSVVILTILWSMGIAALAPLAAKAATCPTLQAGDLFKVPGNSAVYLLNANMQRLYFPHANIYHSWYTDYSGVQEIPTSCVDAYPAPSAPPFGVNYRPGSMLVKVQISPSVYVVEPGNTLAKITSESVASALYGSNWAGQVADVADVFWPNYANRAADITDAVPPNGMLLKVSGGSVYYVSGGMKHLVDGSVAASAVHIVSQAVLNAVGTASDSVTAASIWSNPSQGMGGSTSVPGPIVGQGGSLSVSLAADTPDGTTYAVANAARVPFTKVNFTNNSGHDIVIDSMRIIRDGSPAKNADFNTINAIDANGNLLNDTGKTLNSDNYATFTEDVTIPANSTKALTFVGDIASSVGNGDVPTIDLTMVTPADPTVTVSGLPVHGNRVTMNNNVALGTVTLAEGTVIGSVTKEVGATNVDLASLKISVATNDFQVSRIVLYNSSTAADGDVQNFQLKYNNNLIVKGTMKNKYLTFDLSACGSDCMIQKGNNKTFGVTGDIIGGSGRSIKLTVLKAVHVLVWDKLNNYYVTPTNNATAMNNQVTISTGKLAVSKTNDIPSSNVPTNSSNVALGTFDFRVTGEPVEIRTLVFKVTTTGTLVPTGIDSIVLYDANGKALNGGVDAVGAASPGYATTTDSFVLPVGDNILTVKAKIDNTPVNGDTVSIGIDMSNTSNFDARGSSTGDVVTLGTYATPNSVVSGNTMTINTAALRMTTLSTPASTTYAGGTNDIICEKVLLDANGSSEDLKVTQFQMIDTPYSGAKTQDLQNIRLFVDKDGDSYNGVGSDTALSNVQSGSTATVNTAETITWNLSGSDQFIIKAGKKVVVTVKCNLTGGASVGTHRLHSDGSSNVTLTGIISGSSVVPVVDAAQGQGVSVGTAGGTVQVSIDASSPTASQLYPGGSQGVTLAAFNFYATTTEDVEVQTINFTQRVTDTNSAAFQDYDLLYLVDQNGNVVGSVVPTSTKPTITMNTKAFIVNRTTSNGQILYLKANLTNINPQGVVTVGGHSLGFNIGSTSAIVAKGNQTGSSSVVYFGSSVPNGLTHYMFKGTPTVTVLPVSGKLTNGLVDLFSFQVAANMSDIDVYKFSFDLTTSTAKINALELDDITDATQVTLYTSSTINCNSGLATGYCYIRVLFDTSGNQTFPQTGGQARTVSVSKPRIYVLRGTITGSASGASVSTRLAGDAAVPLASTIKITSSPMASSTVIDTDPNNDFIWSDRSAGAHATTTNDWTNGYGVAGLNSASSTPAAVSQ